MAKNKKRRRATDTVKETPVPKTQTTQVEIDGYTYTIDVDVFDDMELAEDLGKLHEGNAFPTLSILRRILGKQQSAVAMQRLRDENGKIRSEPTVKFVTALLEAANPNS